MRHTSFRVTTMRTYGLLTDWGMAAAVLPAIARMTRTQLVLVLAGHGYFGNVELRAGDLVSSDQRLCEPEGFGGSPCETIHIEWDDDSCFGRVHTGPFAVARMHTRDVGALRALLARVVRTPAARWLRELGACLRALGLQLDTDFGESQASRLSQLYRLVGEAGSTLDAHPTLTDLADSLGVTVRQARRDIRQLIHEYRQPYEGWRDYVATMRMEWTTQLLSVPGLRLSDIARIAGFRSDAALAHAFSMRDAMTPAAMGREIRARLG